MIEYRQNNMEIKAIYKYLKRHNITESDILIIKIDYEEYIKWEITIKKDNYNKQFNTFKDLFNYAKDIVIPYKQYILHY